jgi:tetratricopeptide (TPR) repeat protein
MTSRLVRALLITAIVLGAARVSAGQSPEQRTARSFAEAKALADLKTLVDIAPYLEVVGLYRRGEFYRAAELVQAWDPDKVAGTVGAMCTLEQRLASPPQSRDDLDVADVEAAILLHSDAATKAWQDGRLNFVTIHVAAAIRIATWLYATLGRSGVATNRTDPSISRLNHRDWFLAEARVLTGLMEFGASLSILESALNRFPDDPQLLLASGSAKEGQARLTETQAKSDLFRRWNERQFIRESAKRTAALRRAAERDYRRVLDLDPACAEARLRLGRVLAQAGRLADAEKELRAVLAASDDNYLRYMGSMFLGQVLASGRRLPEAAERYREAIRLQPDCQVCRVALADALDRIGDQTRAEAVLMEFLPRAEPKIDRVDPWWVYPYGRREAGAAALSALRSGVLKQ